MRLLLELKKRGHKNIGFGMTVSNRNSHDLLPMYRLATELGFEFATATFHNSFYFHKNDNVVTNKDEVIQNFASLAEELLKEDAPKSWFRALYNLGLIRYIRGMPRMLPCEAGSANFFIYPYGDVYPCNGLEPKYWVEKMGNIREAKTFDEIWFSEQAKRVRENVRTCAKNCWMVGTAAPVMKKYIAKTGPWVAKHKAMSVLGRSPSLENLPYFDVGQDPRQGDLRLGNGDAQPIAEELEQVTFQGDFEDDNRLVQLGARANAVPVGAMSTESPSADRDVPPTD
jgi:Fe-coproporphyrin III synthase